MKVRVNILIGKGRQVRVIKSLNLDTQEVAERWARDMLNQLKAKGTKDGFAQLYECRGEGYPSEYLIKVIN